MDENNNIIENAEIENNNNVTPPLGDKKDNGAFLRNKAILVPNQSVTRRKAYSLGELLEGDLIFTEKPIVWVARSICSSEICHNCFKDIKTSKTYQCNICLNSYYCSKKCEVESKDVHKYECSLLNKDKFSKLNKYPIHNDIIRLFIRVLSARDIKDKKEEIDSLREELKSYKSKYPKQMISAFEEVSKEITQMLDEKIKIPLEEMIEIFCCLHSSSYGFKSSTWNTDVALGLLRYHSFVSHSCRPNCAFVNNNDTMELRAISHIKEKEELHVSYFDLYQIREERIKKLRFSKFVSCKCERCKEPIEKSKDRFLEGFLCSTQNCKGLYILSNSLDTVKKNMDREIACTECKTTRKFSELNSELEKASKLFVEMLELYQSNKPQKAIKVGEKIETTFVNVFHPMHYILFNTYSILINCHDISQNVSQSSIYSFKVIKCLEFIFPDEKYWEISNYLYHLGCAYYEMSIREKNNKKALELKKLCKDAFMKSYGIRKICCGVEHPDTKIVLTKI